MTSMHGRRLRLFGPADTEPLTGAFADAEVGRWSPGPADGDVVAWWTTRNDRTDESRMIWAVAAVCQQAFGLQRVQFFHSLANPASCAVARVGGFALEGTLRQSFRYADGLRHDEHLHARLADDA
jgi:hypothetical protein